VLTYNLLTYKLNVNNLLTYKLNVNNLLTYSALLQRANYCKEPNYHFFGAIQERQTDQYQKDKQTNTGKTNSPIPERQTDQYRKDRQTNTGKTNRPIPERQTDPYRKDRQTVFMSMLSGSPDGSLSVPRRSSGSEMSLSRVDNFSSRPC